MRVLDAAEDVTFYLNAAISCAEHRYACWRDALRYFLQNL